VKVETIDLPHTRAKGTAREVIMDAIKILTAAMDQQLPGFLAEAGPGSEAAGDSMLLGDRGQVLEVKLSVKVLDRGGAQKAGHA
jgi:hypothetical protein